MSVLCVPVSGHDHPGGRIVIVVIRASATESLDLWLAMWWYVGVSLTPIVPSEGFCLRPLRLPPATSNHDFITA